MDEETINQIRSKVRPEFANWDKDEWLLYCSVLNSFYAYGVHYNRISVKPLREAFFALPSRQVDLLIGPPFNYLDKFHDIEAAINRNGDLALDILETGLGWAGLEWLMEYVVEIETGPGDQTKRVRKPLYFDHQTKTPCVPGLEPAADLIDYSKVSTTLRHLYREWSDGGEEERSKCYEPLVDFVDSFYKDHEPSQRHNIKVLTPGGGTGRLSFEFALRGYDSLGIEISYHMLLGGMHMLNSTTKTGQYQVYPFAIDGANHLTHQDRIRSFTVPCQLPMDMQQEAAEKLNIELGSNFGNTTGDFSVEMNDEGSAESFDVVAMVFFLDTAKNPLSYFETVANCLRTGGIWLNLGPLKWHFQGSYNYSSKEASGTGENQKLEAENHSKDHGIANPGMVLLNEEDIMELLKHYGFKVIHYEDYTRRPTGYIRDPKSMESNMYYPTFWVAQKVGDKDGVIKAQPGT